MIQIRVEKEITDVLDLKNIAPLEDLYRKEYQKSMPILKTNRNIF